MVAPDAELRKRAANAARVVAGLAPVHAVVVFGSHVEGPADQWSDIDIALATPRSSYTRTYGDDTVGL